MFHSIPLSSHKSHVELDAVSFPIKFKTKSSSMENFLKEITLFIQNFCYGEEKSHKTR